VEGRLSRQGSEAVHADIVNPAVDVGYFGQGRKLFEGGVKGHFGQNRSQGASRHNALTRRDRRAEHALHVDVPGSRIHLESQTEVLSWEFQPKGLVSEHIMIDVLIKLRQVRKKGDKALALNLCPFGSCQSLQSDIETRAAWERGVPDGGRRVAAQPGFHLLPSLFGPETPQHVSQTDRTLDFG
jgi:hypothetical protein